MLIKFKITKKTNKNSLMFYLYCYIDSKELTSS